MSLEEDILLLSNVPIFSHLEKDALRLLAFAAESIELKEGEILFSYGDLSDGSYVIKDGAIRLQSPNQSETITVGTHSLIGQSSLFVKVQRPATAIASTHSSIIRISSNLMKRCLKEYPQGAGIIYNLLAQEVQDITRRMLRISNKYLEHE